MVVVDCPELLRKANVNPEKAALLRAAAEVVGEARAVAAAVRRGLDAPASLSPQRRSIARELFYGPGGATARATRCVYHALALPAPAPLPEIERAEATSMFTTLKRGPVKCEL